MSSVSGDSEIGARVRDRVSKLPYNHREVAEAAGMKADAFSRSLNGQRAFSAMELAKLWAMFEVDVHWLITGGADPFRLNVAARHDFDAVTGSRSVPGFREDKQTLADIGLAYQQAYRGVAPEVPPNLPENLEKTRVALGEGFVRPFVDRLQAAGIDVVRVQELTTSYCFTTTGRHVIVIAATGNWFRENYALAHELGHLVLGHLGVPRKDHERAANAFAAELLMPADAVAGLDWTYAGPAVVAERLWHLGVSTDALANRLDALRINVSSDVRESLEQSTQRLLRRHWTQPMRENSWGRFSVIVDQITDRMQEAARRRFPKSLEETHMDRIAAGELGKGTLAWMLGIPADALEVDAPPATETWDLDELDARLS